MASRVVAVIPARLGSRRFSGKVLYPFHGKPLLFYVWNRLRRCRTIDRLLIATDSREIADSMADYGAEVMMTPGGLKTGSDRVAAVARKTKGEIYVNVQADCFGLSPAAVDRTITAFRRERTTEFGTLARNVGSDDELFDPNCVKLVVDDKGYALWFSRFPIPYLQNRSEGECSTQFRFMKHIGIYLFRRKALLRFASWNQHRLEKAESLEQLRILANGGRLRVYTTTMKMTSIETLQDLEKVDRLR